MNVNVLIVDGERQIQTLFKRILGSQVYRVTAVDDAKSAYLKLAQKNFKVAMINFKLRDTTGLDLLQYIKNVQPECRCIIMTGYGSIETAIRAIQLGAYDYLEKPFESLEKVRRIVQSVGDFGEKESNHTEFESIRSCADTVGMVIGNSKEMRKVITTAYKIANKKVNVLISGETGTGKDVLARFIHAASDRKNNLFVPINCGALHESLLESELFGHEKGAFTGSNGTRKGIFELANKGTLFLDELSEASQAIQVKLLRVLETGEFLRLGGEKPIKTDVRIITATNANIENLVRSRKFRKDLYYRLNVVRLDLIPLRQRSEDIIEFVKHFAEKVAANYNHPTPPLFTELALHVLQCYPWYGNVRELYSIIQKIVLKDVSGVIDIKHLPKDIINSFSRQNGQNQSNFSPQKFKIQRLKGIIHSLNGLNNPQLEGKSSFHPRLLQDVEKEYIERTIEYYNGNVTLAARALGISRATLYRKIKQ
ncbi:sigma-54-dependent transcriptional regulator [Desulforamulus ruminis]|uniref:Stage 0 sporulation protein A homolog n=1 Tax=Desulforamulus ruminis (strain ATCC 23193 / DSM 2154 / NCIMB 8452 / DL) TaxID=696281 RepID=F6DLS7_DESRL|nr:sigma-54 dependent transcriptional regulator [Desulforamulus ruminis]AEG58370.1 sigma-54 factor interaction domain-containing protein [Desulforamulus ruminis DSM 2154]